MTSFDSPSNGLMVEGAAMNMNLGMYKWVMALWNAKATNMSDSYHDLLDQQVFCLFRHHFAIACVILFGRQAGSSLFFVCLLVPVYCNYAAVK
jgi:hypothetical protein